MAPWGYIIRIVMMMEDAIVSRILQSPRFHHGVRKIHRTIEDIRYGRDPNEPLKPGEATEDPNIAGNGSFITHFIDELKNQFRGPPSDPPPPSGPPGPPRK
ncbi:hypothetical protein QBC46DRAFT_347092 [Diplogelasinospora grovesii]|uniref:Uncharacterized protein n=1 Tax=Diplogelasinospora grovesii TaxID=303347 RepID=A0AAN6RZL3_9PEZI|nr:hypothetical protein QBC46DRAFT_347092 [Diplogelasinospora grovesii]